MFFTMRNVGCTERWQNLHLQRHSKDDRTRPWAACSHERCFEQEVGLESSRCPRGHFQPSWFYRNTPIQIMPTEGKLPRRLSKKISRGCGSICITKTV